VKGEKMLEAMKNACIFLLIAQILMVLVPEEAYAKYVRVLVSLILILKITQPLLSLVSGREAREVMQSNVEQLCVELSVRELPSAMQSETGNLYEHMTEYVVGQIAQEQDLQKLDQHGQNKQEQTTGEEVTDQQQMIEDTEREQ
jgi:stage III sporulation protein AF